MDVNGMGVGAAADATGIPIRSPFTYQAGVPILLPPAATVGVGCYGSYPLSSLEAFS